MTIDDVRASLREGGLSPETQRAVEEVLMEAEEHGGLTDESKNKILELIDLEVALVNLETESYTDQIEALQNLSTSLDEAINESLRSLEELHREVDQEIKKLDDS